MTCGLRLKGAARLVAELVAMAKRHLGNGLHGSIIAS
jgi:hypothetical protein